MLYRTSPASSAPRTRAHLRRYPNAEVVWAQEEPKNMGAWDYVRPRMMTARRVINGETDPNLPGYVGRMSNASPAVGYGALHAAEQEEVIETALSSMVTSEIHGLDTERERGYFASNRS